METKNWYKEYAYAMVIKVEIIAIVWSLCWVYSMVNFTLDVYKVYYILAMLIRLVTVQYVIMSLCAALGFKNKFVFSLVGISKKEMPNYMNLNMTYGEFFVQTYLIPVSIIAYNVLVPIFSTMFLK